jgi:hypothetical protein
MRLLQVPVIALLVTASSAFAQSDTTERQRGLNDRADRINQQADRLREQAAERSRALADPELYARTKEEWLSRVEASPDNVDVLDAAAGFFMIRDRALSEQLLERARVLEPNNYRWPEKLAQVHKLNASSGDLNEARLAFVEMERAFALMPEKDRRTPPDLATMAFEAGDFNKARFYAERMLDGRVSNRPSASGDAVHKANLVLGRLAIIEGRLPDAVKFLHASAAHAGSPALGSFGPNMQLARQLLELGEREAVLTYLEMCRAFWKMGGDRLDRWAREIQAGVVPNFGANLQY